MICVSLGRSRHKHMLEDHQALADRGAELVELRLDFIARAPDLSRLIKSRPTPTIVTCRRSEDRGRFDGDEDSRRKVLRQAIADGVEYVDLEEDVARDTRRYGKTKRIISYHNFDLTPEDLDVIHERLAKLDPDYIKIVTMANSPQDNLRMLEFVQRQTKIPTIGFCMGDFGLVSRLLCGRFGSPFSYCTASKDREMAPGQLAFEEMRKLYRYDSINRETAIFGVVGDPIAHSWSPFLHNAAFKRAGMNAVYIPLRIPPDTLPESLQAYQKLGLRGVSVTIPHKEAAVKFAQKPDDLSREIGAANTLWLDRDRQWRATNTDLPAAMESVQLGLAQKNLESLSGQRVLILGAGGAARAIALGASRAGAVVSIANRNKQRGNKLAEELGCQFSTWSNRGAVQADVIINCTPVGMHPNMDESPYEQHWFRDGQIVFDTIYNPENTLLLKNAREHLCHTVSGIEMFVRQAQAQFKLFTGKTYPLDDMRTTLRRAISAVRVRTESGHASPTEAADQTREEKPAGESQA